MKEDSNNDINMRYDNYPTTKGDGNGNGNFLQDRSTIISATAPSSQQTQDILMSDSHQHQLQQPAPESDPTANASTNAGTFSHLSQTPPTCTHMLNPAHAKDHSSKNTPTSHPVFTVQTSSSMKSGKGRCTSAAGVKSPSSSVTPTPSASMDGFTIVSAAAPSQQTQDSDTFMSNSRQHQLQQPTPESDHLNEFLCLS
ncbi:hypothetical protein AZE42_11096 [Rhizopogon vesiculosus]|uniref:Uncharacterized protein n=1 Tax=Rhizopogon vesiculosus TaxID=180088 RepID=A0A1J8QI26_9AGAM|nr:hypothetical protein AZE42_11096 [Rhizopogon vesiculosus]